MDPVERLNEMASQVGFHLSELQARVALQPWALTHARLHIGHRTHRRLNAVDYCATCGEVDPIEKRLLVATSADDGRTEAAAIVRAALV